MNQQAQAIQEAYEIYCQLFSSATSTIEEQRAAFDTYQQLRDAYEASR